MLQVYLGKFYLALERVRLVRERIDLYQGAMTAERKTEILEKGVKALDRVRAASEEMGFEATPEFIKFSPLDDHLSPEQIKQIMTSTLTVAENEGGSHWCYKMARPKSDFYLTEVAKWQKIADQFPSAYAEGYSALSCYAVDQNTACVFHLMRAAELGLRTLARERRVSVPKKPLDWATWQDVLVQLSKKVELFGKRRAGPTKDAALQFYQGALGEFAAFKDTYRNVVMHVRKHYDEHEAASAALHVREFMTRLAARLSETERKAIRWGKF